MYKLWKYYNQNKLKVWTIILVIVLGMGMIKTLNNNIKKQKLEKNNDNKETTSNVVSYHNESKSMITENSVSELYSNEFGKLIEQFFSYCVEHNPQMAYTMLSDDTKQELYQTEELFEKNYYLNKFEGNKKFSFQSWSSANSLYVYQVKIYDNMLATGMTNDNYIKDYVTISSQNGECKLNINKYLGRDIINKKTENNIVSVEVMQLDKYLDYQIYTLSIQNKTDNNIILDTRRKNNTCYVIDRLKNKFEAILYENNEDDLEFKPNEIKRIKIKFNITNRENLKIKSINFTDIVNKEEYINNRNIEGETFKIDI